VSVEAPPGRFLAFSMESQFCGLSARSFSQLRVRGPDSALAIRVRARHSFIERGERMKRKATAVWRGDVKTGKGSLSTESTVLENAQYSFSTRFENGIGTNPEELLAAAHAGCFAMALSAQLGMANLTARRLDVTATITLERVGEHHAVTKSHLDLSAQVPGATREAFDAAVKAAEVGCPVSKLFRAAISVEAHLDAASSAT
jgi:osmotically inducible protein OsmC